jgi:hypothetical protein
VKLSNVVLTRRPAGKAIPVAQSASDVTSRNTGFWFGVKISRQTSAAFLGPFALGALALASDDPTARQAALEKGDELLRTGAVSHNHLLFPRDAIDADGTRRWAPTEASPPD